MWSVADAKSQLSEILRQARAGKPQFVGAQNPCVVVSLETYQLKITAQEHDGAWLIAQTARLNCDLPEFPRAQDRADPVFED